MNNIDFVPSETPVPQKCNVVINGKVRGEVWNTNGAVSSRFQCQLRFVHLFMVGGFGDTMEEAVKDAIHGASTRLAEMKADFDAFLEGVDK